MSNAESLELFIVLAITFLALWAIGRIAAWEARKDKGAGNE
jgi:hypothetical protein